MSRNELEDPESWAVRTFGQAELGDLRRTDRLVQLAAALARDPQSSLAASLRAEAETVGASSLAQQCRSVPRSDPDATRASKRAGRQRAESRC